MSRSTAKSALPPLSAVPGLPAGETLLQSLPGKMLVLGLTFVDSKGVLVDQHQTSGRVEEVDANGMATLRQSDGSAFRFPVDPMAIKPAGPGEYRVRNSGVKVLNPDFLGHFEVEVQRNADVERYRMGGYPANWQPPV